MRKYRVEITPAAEADIQDIFEFIRSDNPPAAAAWIEELEQQISTLEQFPLRCPVIPEAADLGKEYRHLIHGNYRTLFMINKSTVIILRVIHGSRLHEFNPSY